MEFRHPIITAALIDRALESLPARTRGIHGLPHWLRVERNALYLARQTGGDPAVVSLFALFHDARRYNDGFDPGHGARGARLAEELHADGLLPIGSSQLEQLVYAAVNHTEVHFSDDVTVTCCWD